MMLKLSFFVVTAITLQLCFEAFGVLNMYPTDIISTGFGDVQAAAVERAESRVRSCSRMTQWFVTMVIGVEPRPLDLM